MTPEQLYARLLTVYPGRFRREFRDGMLDAFRELRRAHTGTDWAFWRFVLADLFRSAFSAQIDAFRQGPRRFFVEWIAACASGAIAIGLLANALTSAFRYFYHPFLEGIALPPWSYGALLGAALGTAQTLVLRKRFRLGLLWVAASAVGTSVGLEGAIATAKIAGPVGYGLVLGCAVGSIQWMVLRTRVHGAAWWGLGSTAALSAAMLSCGVSLHTTLNGLNAVSRDPLAAEPGAYGAAVQFLARGLYAPSTGADLAVELAVMATTGLVVGALTVRPLASMYGHQERS